VSSVDCLSLHITGGSHSGLLNLSTYCSWGLSCGHGIKMGVARVAASLSVDAIILLFAVPGLQVGVRRASIVVCCAWMGYRWF